MQLLKYNSHIFDQIEYLAPSNEQTLSPHYDNMEFFSRVIQFRYLKEPGESYDEYTDRVLDELNSSPLLGFVPSDTQLFDLMQHWINTGHYTSLFDEVDYANGAPLTIYNQPYFLTSDTNYNVVDVDLLGGNDDGSKEKQFLDFINHN